MRKIVLFVVLVLLLVFSGCVGRGPSEQRVEEDYHKGTRGLDISFIRNAPPDRIYEGDSLDISIEVKNLGAFPEEKGFEGKLELSGFDPSSIKGHGMEETEYLQA